MLGFIIRIRYPTKKKKKQSKYFILLFCSTNPGIWFHNLISKLFYLHKRSRVNPEQFFKKRITFIKISFTSINSNEII